MSKTTKELLNEARQLRLSFRKNDSAPVGNFIPQISLPWVRGYYQVLAPVGYNVRNLIWHIYFPDIDSIWELHTSEHPPDTMTVIIHGHKREGFCSANTLCHVLGFDPKELEEVPSHFNYTWKKFGYDG